RGPAGIAAVCADRAGEDARRRFPRHPRVHGVVRCAGGRGRRLGAGAWAGTGTGGVRRRRRRLRGARWTSVALAGEGWGGGQWVASEPTPIPAFPRKRGKGRTVVSPRPARDTC